VSHGVMHAKGARDGLSLGRGLVNREQAQILALQKKNQRKGWCHQKIKQRIYGGKEKKKQQQRWQQQQQISIPLLKTQKERERKREKRRNEKEGEQKEAKR